MGAFYSRAAHNVAVAESGKASLMDLTVEHFAIFGGIGIMIVYPTCIYLSIWILGYPVRKIVEHSWDVLLASFILMFIAGKLTKRPPSRKAIEAMEPAEQEAAKKARKASARNQAMQRNVALVVSTAVALARWQYGHLSSMNEKLLK